MEAQQTEMMQILQQIQHDQHDHAFRNEHNMSGLNDEMADFTVRVEDLQDHVSYVGTPPH